TVYFLDRIVGELRKKERSIERRELNAENQQRLARLAMSSAGAAHELGTPLAIIAVVAHELQRRIEQLENPADIIDDFKILKDQAERCKQILEEMRARAGDFSGEMPESITLGHLIEEAILACGASSHTVPIERAIGDSDHSFIVHRKALIRA